jgi:transposase
MTIRRRFTPDFKAKVELKALRGDRTIQEIAGQIQGAPEPDEHLEAQAMNGLGDVFSNGADHARRDRKSEVHDLHAKIGQLTVERDFLAKGLKR